jgi:hypothetical protein
VEKSWGLRTDYILSIGKLQFEFTGLDTRPQHKLAKGALSTIACRYRARMSRAKVPKEYRQLFWREAFQTATYIDGFLIVKMDDILKTRFERQQGKLRRFLEHGKKLGL